MRLVGLLLLLCVDARAQVDTANGTPRANLDLPRDALDLKTRSEDLHVPPAWRDVERDGAAAFHPSARVVSERAPAAMVLRQLDAFHAAERAIEEGHGDPAITQARDEAAELRRKFEDEPAEWRRTQIEVTLAADGELQSIVVASSSGRRELDREAMRAVRHALGRTRPRGKSVVTVRFACDAGVVAAPPILGTAGGDPRGQGVTAGMRLRFDETTRKVEPQIPFVPRVVTRIRIIDFALSENKQGTGNRKPETGN